MTIQDNSVPAGLRQENGVMLVIDFAIVTALPEEFELLRQLLPPLYELSEGADVWYRTRLVAPSGANYEIVAAFQNNMGTLDAENLTARTIKRWKPAYIILVGIAGSFYKDARLGDVIVSQQIFYFDPGKATERGIAYRPEGYPCSAVLIRQTEALRLDQSLFEAWQQAAKDSAGAKAEQLSGAGEEPYRKSLQAHTPQIHFGTIASGSLKIASKRKQTELVALHGRIVGTEMEGAGVLHATFREELPTPAIAIKGISDKADTNMDREDPKQHWRALAKENPVRLLLALLRRGRIRALHTNQFELDLTRGSIDDVRRRVQDMSAPGVSYLAFPRLLVPKGPLTGFQIEMEVYGQQGPLDVIRRVVEYRDQEGKVVSDSGSGSRARVDKPVMARPIGAYLLSPDTPARIVFSVSIPDSPSNKRTTEWLPNRE